MQKSLEFKGKVIIDFLDKKLKGDNKMKLQIVKEEDFEIVMNMINVAKQHLKEQGIDQQQNGYPDEACIHNDIINKRGYFLSDKNQELGYLCIDFDGEPAYEKLDGKWLSDGKYVVVHRLALSEKARGKNISSIVFQLVEELALEKGITAFRVDTDADNQKMQHILKKNGFTFCGTIWFDNSEKIAFEKILKK